MHKMLEVLQMCFWQPSSIHAQELCFKALLICSSQCATACRVATRMRHRLHSEWHVACLGGLPGADTPMLLSCCWCLHRLLLLLLLVVVCLPGGLAARTAAASAELA